MKCRSCGGETKPFFSLGKIPLVNSFPKKKDIPKEKKYELGIAFCPHCKLVQLTHTIPPEKLYRDYIYFSSVSQTILDHAQKTAKTRSKGNCAKKMKSKIYQKIQTE